MRGSATVIGAGAVGTACALQLARRGYAVRLIDWRKPGEGCSYGNAGAISGQSVVPIALPGMLRQVPGWLLDPQGPLHVRWRYLPRALPWLARWIAASRMAVVQRSALALKALLRDAPAHYAELLGPGPFGRFVRQQGQLLVWESASPSRSERVGHFLRERHGVEMQWLTGGEVNELEPELAPIFARGLLLKRHGHMTDPNGVVRAMAQQLLATGGTFDQARVVEIEPGEAWATTLRLDDGRSLKADNLVITAGAWSHRLARFLGVSVPLETERGYHVQLDGVTGLCSRPIMHADRSFIASPMQSGMRVAGTVEIAGVDAPPCYERADVLAAQARRMFPSLQESKVERWMGCRPSLPDSVPIIDRCPNHPSIFFAFGHGHLGMTGAPMTGKLIAQLVDGEPPSIDLAPYRATRF
jgi:glycine/D-amino acid oxidase-like deaminating enzyme